MTCPVPLVPAVLLVLMTSCSSGSRPGDTPPDGGDGGEDTETDTGDGWGSAPGWQLSWVVQAGGSSGDPGDLSSAVSASGGDSVCIGGYLHGSEDIVFGPETTNEIWLPPGTDGGFLSCYRDTGVPRWVVSAGEEKGGAYDIATLADGGLLSAGSTWAQSTFGPGEENETQLGLSCSLCPFISRYREDGSFEWVRAGDGSGAVARIWGVSATADGASCVAGEYTSKPLVLGVGEANETTLPAPPDGSQDGFVARYSSAGDLLWARRIGGPGEDGSTGAAVLPDGSCAAIVRYEGDAEVEAGEGVTEDIGSGGEWGYVVVLYDVAGDAIWIEDLGVSGDVLSYETHAGISAYGSGVAIAGGFNGSVISGSDGSPEVVSAGAGTENRGLFVTRLAQDGSWLWTSTVLGPSADLPLDSVSSVSARGDGTILVGGRFSGSKTFGSGEPAEARLECLSSDVDGFLALYYPDGSLGWAFRLVGGAQGYSGWSVGGRVNGADARGLETIFATGVFEGTATIGTGAEDAVELQSFGELDIFLARLDRTGSPN